MGAFSTAFTQFFTAISVLFSALEKLCLTADNLATVASEESGAYKDQARSDRLAKLAALNKQNGTSITTTDDAK